MPRRRADARFRTIYQPAFVCFACRKVFKRTNADFARGVGGLRIWNFETWEVTCPQCGGRMAYPGPQFKAPPRDDTRAWAIAEALVRGGFRFLHFGARAFDDHPFPRHLRDVPRFLEAYHRARRGRA